MIETNLTPYNGEYTYTYSNNTDKIFMSDSVSSIVQELLDKILFLEEKICALEEKIKTELIEEIKNNIGTW